MEPNCKNAFVQLGKYGFKCADNLVGLFGVDVSLKDLCCATCTPPTSTPAKTTKKTTRRQTTTTSTSTTYTLTTTTTTTDAKQKSTSTKTPKKTTPKKAATTTEAPVTTTTPAAKACKSKCGLPEFKGDGNCDDINKFALVLFLCGFGFSCFF